MTGTQVLLLVASETGHVYTFATPKLQPLITKPEGKNLIQACLNSPDLPSEYHGGAGGGGGGGAGGGGGYEGAEEHHGHGGHHHGHGKEPIYEERPASAGLGHGGGGGLAAANYAAAIAGMAGYPYASGTGSSGTASTGSNAPAGPGAYLNPAHYPAYAAAMAANYWQQQAQQQHHDGVHQMRKSSSQPSPHQERPPNTGSG